jgi:hypothetical protein
LCENDFNEKAQGNEAPAVDTLPRRSHSPFLGSAVVQNQIDNDDFPAENRGEKRHRESSTPSEKQKMSGASWAIAKIGEGQRSMNSDAKSPMVKRVALDMSALMAPNSYIQSLPSKNFRSQIIDVVDLWLHLPSQPLKLIEQVIDDPHNSSLILDDIQDESSINSASRQHLNTPCLR